MNGNMNCGMATTDKTALHPPSPWTTYVKDDPLATHSVQKGRGTQQNMSQQPGSSAARGRVDEGRGVEGKMEVVARAVSEAAIAKGKMYNITEHQATALCCHGDCHCCHGYM